MSITEACPAARRHPLGPGGRGPQGGRPGGPRPPGPAGRPGRRVLHRLPEPASRGGLLADLGLGSRRALGLGRGTPCDTTLYRLLAEQSPAGLEGTLFAQVKDLIARKVVKNDRLHVGVISFDGNGAWSRVDGERMPGAVQSTYDGDGSSVQTFGALRAALTSSSVCPCVEQRLIGSKEGESPAFRELLPKVCEQLGGQFRIVTGDAGLCARENAELVTSLGRWYVLGLKGNQPYLHDFAREHGEYGCRRRARRAGPPRRAAPLRPIPGGHRAATSSTRAAPGTARAETSPRTLVAAAAMAARAACSSLPTRWTAPATTSWGV